MRSGTRGRVARAPRKAVRERKRNIKAQLRQFKENERLRAALRLCCYAVVALVPFYLFVRASRAWTPHPRYFPDDAFYARLCLPDGLLLYWHDYRLYRLLALAPYALLNRAVMRAYLSPAPLALGALALATFVFVRACIGAGLSRRRGVLLAGVLLSSPLLLETVNFWSGTLNYALVLVLCAAQLRASVWARQVEHEPSKGLMVTAGGALLALVTYEIALPFVLATSALYAHGWARRVASVVVACVALAALVAALSFAGLYWPARFKFVADQLTFANAPQTVNATVNAQETVNATADTAASTPADAATTGGSGNATRVRAASGFERAWMYGALLLSFIFTGLRSAWFWVVVAALAGLSFLSRGRAGEASVVRRLPENLVATGFAFALAACVAYLLLTKSMNARYAAFLLIYGAAALAWTKGRAAGLALAALLVLQAAVVASLPVHMRDVEAATTGQAASYATGRGDVISVNGRLARASWGKRFVETEAVDWLKQPLSSRACRYSVPCEQCK
ncbi:MAG TPA: hypothetical protein VER76_13660 [Pyrinomonadaceae bacterium]|nr:hypothetical protein [Pyrinomonadaceae bacterium]